MARRSQKARRHALKRGKKHALSANVVSPRIVFITFLQKTKHFIIYTAVTCLLLFLCWGVFFSARKLVMDGDRFQLDAIVISPTPDTESFFSYQNLPQISGLKVNDSIFAHSLDELEKRLETYPEVLEATLVREFPGTIKIDIVEREPVAQLLHQDAVYLIDPSGLCFKPSFPNPSLTNRLPQLQTQYSADLPFDLETKMLGGIGMERALALTQEWAKQELYGERLVVIKVKDLHSITTVTDTGVSLLFGYYEHERQIQDYNSIQSHAYEQGKRIKSVNLLPFENIPVTFDESNEPLPSAPKVIPQKKTNVDSDMRKILNQG